ncbi:hypothetical protein PSI15_06835 [Xenorhabdus sp. PR6a]|uniref:hypothetical protein n=1 Tax=Xenorhabdus sp. PR6a TaxID=3025877 RepID=UPI002358A003|nr:hypothetical protein [Xenorhabdus sp. PR6a]MDC9581284.1 hypothetical protein [Xenorhabdus sp. PR6a]
MLKKLLKEKKSLTFIEAHNPLSALIIKNQHLLSKMQITQIIMAISINSMASGQVL